MRRCHHGGKRARQIIIDATLPQPRRQHVLAVEAVHDQHGFAQHGGYSEIEIGIETAVDGEFVLQHLSPLLDAGEIEIGKLHVLLDLEGTVAGEKHMRRMGLMVFDGSSGKPPGRSLEKGGIEHETDLATAQTGRP